MADTAGKLADEVTVRQNGGEPIAASVDCNSSIPEQFEHFATECPDRLAIKTPDECLTFAALDRESNRVARVIQALHRESQFPIALLVEQGAALAIGILGVLKTGRCYVSLKTSHPSQRLGLILEDSQAELMLTNTRNFPLANALVANRFPVVNIDSIDPTISGERIES